LYKTVYSYYNIVYNVLLLFVHCIQCFVIVAFMIFIVINTIKHDQNILLYCN
jgi:large-conductance mechanosensitive channel